MDRFRFFILIVAIASTLPAVAPAQDVVPLLQAAIRERIAVSINQRTGHKIPAVHCRKAPHGCNRRLAEFARYIVDAANRQGVDPWLMAAMALRESGFNPFATGSVGEMGILQIHPKSPRAKQVRFIQDHWYRKRCRKQPGACQKEIVEQAAKALARAIELCDGDLRDALGAYNTGRCGGNLSYAKRILKERVALRRMAGLETGQS